MQQTNLAVQFRTCSLFSAC